MVTKTYILRNIKQLNHLYNQTSGNTKKELYYSRLALLELCGWIEESMDDVILMCGNRCLKDHNNRDYVNKTIVRRTHGFLYRDHFRRMLIQTIGVINVEKLERKVNQTNLIRMESILKRLYDNRNKEAHTHIKGVTRRIDAPSITLNSFHTVYTSLKDFEQALKNLGY